MFESFRARNPGRSIPSLFFYELGCALTSLTLMTVYRMRVHHRTRVPKSGVFLVVVNHQSHFDPILAGLSVRPRHLNYLARSTLFSNPAFAWLIRSLNSIPLKQGESDIVAIRTAIDNLKDGRCMLIFPEGTRTRDGAMHAFKRGAWLLISRAKCPVLPVAVEGAFDAFPRGASFPKLFGQRLASMVGEPIAYETLAALGPERALKLLSSTIEGMRLELADRLTSQGVVLTTSPFSDDESPE